MVKYTLSSREKQVARLVLKGKSNVEIAKKLNLKVRTVESYVVRLREKTGFPSSTAQAAKIAKESGML